MGKGCGNRAFTSQYKSAKVPNTRERILIQEYECEEDAFAAEMFFISLFGRIDLGTGILRNKTNGGDGLWGVLGAHERGKAVGALSKGRKLSEATKQKLRAHSLRLNSARTLVLGAHTQKHTEETKQLISRLLKGRVAWNKGRQMGTSKFKGMTLEERYGSAKAEDIRKKYSLAKLGRVFGPRGPYKKKIA